MVIVLRPINRCRVLRRQVLRARSNAPQETQQGGQFAVGEIAVEPVAELGEDVGERLGPAVVQKALALANTAERRRIELPLAMFIRQADVVGFGRGVGQRRHVAAARAAVVKQFAAALDLPLIAGFARRRLQWGRGRQGLQERGQVFQAVRRGIRIFGIAQPIVAGRFQRFVQLIAQFTLEAAPGPRVGQAGSQ